MTKRGKLIAGVTVVGILAVLVVPRFFKPVEVAEPAALPVVRAEKPENSTITLYRELTGVIEPADLVYVTPKLAGEVTEVYVKAGDYVTEGQAICRIDNRQLDSARIAMETAQVALNDAQANVNRMQVLYASGDISAQVFEQSQSAFSQAQLQYSSAKLNYDTQMEYTTITAPIAGVVETCDVDVHDMISQSAPVCVISGGEGMMVKFSVPEKIALNLSAGDELYVEKGGETYNGTITEVNTMVDASTGLFPVKGSLPEAENLSTGSTVKLSVVSEKAENVMTLPVDTIYYEGGDAYLYTYEEGTIHKVPVEAGIYDSERIQILSGIDGDTMVLTTWNSELYDGAAVTLEEASAPADGQTEAPLQAEGQAEASSEEDTQGEAGSEADGQ